MTVAFTARRRAESPRLGGLVKEDAGRAAMSGPLSFGGPGGRSAFAGTRLGAALQVAGPVRRLLAPELVQVLPGVQAGVVAVVEDQLDRVLADRVHRADVHVLLAQHERLLPRTVALHLGRGGVHPQVLERQLEAAAVVEAHLEQPRRAAQADFSGNGLGHRARSIGNSDDWTRALLQRNMSSG